MADKIQSISELPVADILVGDRLRPVSDAGVEAIIASVNELGVIKDPIHVRKVRHQGDRLILMAGAHRLEAAKRLGWDTIPATVWTCTDIWAQLMEVDDNLASAELTALDNAVFLAARKRLYEELHPETKQGMGRWNKTDTMSVSSFAKSTAEKFGLTDRHVRRMVAAGSALRPQDIQQLRIAPRPVTLADVQEIGKIGDADERDAVCQALATGTSKRAAQARKTWARRDTPTPPVDPIEAEANALVKLWGRSKKAGRDRFVRRVFKDLQKALAEAEAVLAEEEDRNV